MLKVLIVDDDPTIRKLISEVLTRQGFQVLTASDGIDAMLILKQEKPNLLVLDIMMPELNGYDVCHHIKTHPETKDVPIILLTSRDREIDPRLGALMGVEYLHKSCSPRELVAKIRQILKIEQPKSP